MLMPDLTRPPNPKLRLLVTKLAHLTRDELNAYADTEPTMGLLLTANKFEDLHSQLTEYVNNELLCYLDRNNLMINIDSVIDLYIESNSIPKHVANLLHKQNPDSPYHLSNEQYMEISDTLRSSLQNGLEQILLVTLHDFLPQWFDRQLQKTE